jgi:hypothetical protein
MKLNLHLLSTFFLSVACIFLGSGASTNNAHGRNLEKNVTLTDDLSLTDQVTYETDVYGDEEAVLVLDQYSNEEFERLSPEATNDAGHFEEDAADANDLEKLNLLQEVADPKIQNNGIVSEHSEAYELEKLNLLQEVADLEIRSGVLNDGADFNVVEKLDLLQEVADLNIQNSVVSERTDANDLEKMNLLQEVADLKIQNGIVSERADVSDLEKMNLLQEVADLKVKNSVLKDGADATDLEKMNLLQEVADLKLMIQESEKVQDRVKQVESENKDLVREVASLKQFGELQTEVANEQAASHLKELDDLNKLVASSREVVSATQSEKMSLVETIDRNNVIISELQNKVMLTDDRNWWIAACALLAAIAIAAILSRRSPASVTSSKIQTESMNEDFDKATTAVQSKSAKQLGGGSKNGGTN